jgi:hypothetical protein
MARRAFDNPNQMNLLDLIKNQEATLLGRSTDEPGSLNMTSAVRNALYEAIKQSGLTRWQIAAKMSELLDQEVSKYMLDAWTSESKEGHRFPMEYAPAFCKATGSNRVLETVCRPVGMFALPCPDALRSELQRLSDKRKELQASEKELKGMLDLFERAEK